MSMAVSCVQQIKTLAKEAEQRIQQAVAKISGQMMLTLGQNVLQSPGSATEKMQSFRCKMQTFGSQLKTDMQKNSKNLQTTWPADLSATENFGPAGTTNSTTNSGHVTLRFNRWSE